MKIKDKPSMTNRPPVPPKPISKETKISPEKYKRALQLGILTINEVRKHEGLPAIKDGDALYLGQKVYMT